jgi:hypothetical protein
VRVVTDWHATLAARRKGAATELPKLTKPPPEAVQAGIGGLVSPQAVPSEGLEALQLKLERLADYLDLPPSLVATLPPADVEACAGFIDDELAAYLRLLDASARMERGERPAEYNAASWCDGCGPVWLWAGLPARVVGCPWCRLRKAGRLIPRPPVRCGGCRHFRPDAINPEAGMGACGLNGKPAHYPMRPHACESFQRKPTADQGVSY